MAKTVKPEEYFINAYVSELFEYESAISATHRMRRILDAKEEKGDLNEVITEQCRHLNTEERNKLLNLLRKYEEIFDSALGTWNTTPVDLDLRDNVKPVCWHPYPVPRVHEAMLRK